MMGTRGTYQSIQLLPDATAVVPVARHAYITAEQQQDAPLALWPAKQRRVDCKLCRMFQVGNHKILQITVRLTIAPLWAGKAIASHAASQDLLQ